MLTTTHHGQMQIVLAEPHPLVRRGLMQILKDGFDRCTVHEAKNANELMEEVSSSAPDLLVVDLSLPGGPGLGILKRIQGRVGTSVPVIVTSDDPGPEFTKSALQAGATAVVLKERADEELLYTIESVRQGHHLY
ncbi:Transcriptional activator protein ExaE [Anaerolineae bacterium]|nr:Transcriptional activator protein ExaE [Anaerolineae bacterium]